MKKSYYVNRSAQSGGEHEVHEKSCRYMPNNPIYLGDYYTCADAIKKAREHYNNVDGCYYCSTACHTR